MLTINDLRDQFEIQGYIEVKSFNEMGEDEQIHYSGDAEQLDADNPIADAEIKFMYVDAPMIDAPAMVIEIERSE